MPRKAGEQRTVLALRVSDELRQQLDRYTEHVFQVTGFRVSQNDSAIRLIREGLSHLLPEPSESPKKK